MAADIRPARATDVDALSAIEHAVFMTDRISTRSFRRLIGSSSATVLVAAADDAILGYAVLLFRDGSRMARLYSIAAAPGQDRAGVGQALLAAAEAAALRRSAECLCLEVRENNARAIGLYERNSYRRTGRKDDYYDDGSAALRYRKRLAGVEPRKGGALRGGTLSK
jgi:ribosomal protein S18 acetylase RimI-like enzyme